MELNAKIVVHVDHSAERYSAFRYGHCLASRWGEVRMRKIEITLACYPGIQFCIDKKFHLIPTHVWHLRCLRAQCLDRSVEHAETGRTSFFGLIEEQLHAETYTEERDMNVLKKSHEIPIPECVHGSRCGAHAWQDDAIALREPLDN